MLILFHGVLIVFVSKRDGTVRYCIDLRKVRDRDNGSEDKNAESVEEEEGQSSVTDEVGVEAIPEKGTICI